MSEKNDESQVRLEVCAVCKQHGRFINREGRALYEFAHQTQALLFLPLFVEKNVFDFLESAQLREQLKNSVLPEEHTAVPIAMLWNIEAFNVEMGSQKDIDLNAHEFIFQEIDEEEIDPKYRAALNKFYGTVEMATELIN